MNAVNKRNKRVMTELEIGEIGSQRLSTKIPSCIKLSKDGTNIVLKHELVPFTEFFGASIRYTESIVSEVLYDSGFISLRLPFITYTELVPATCPRCCEQAGTPC